MNSGNGKRPPGALVRWIMIPVGLLFAVTGVLTFWLPLPIGLPLLLLGGLILVRHSAYARQAVATASRRYPVIRRGLRQIRRLRNGGRWASTKQTKPAPSESSE